MKKQILNIFAFAMIGLAVVACKDKAKEANTSDAEAATVAESTSAKYVANVGESTIEWKGFKPTGSHTGTIAIENGVFTTNDGKIHSGTFLIDMNSITNTDMPVDNENNAKLVGHLKSADFFDVAKFPSAAFEVTGTKAMEAGKVELSGNLTIKGVKNNVTFPATVTNNDGTMTLVSDTFTIDRSKWNVKYGSKSFFDNLGDKFINDDMELKISVTAKKN